MDINFNSRVIGKDSEYFHLLLDSAQMSEKTARQTSSSQTVGSAVSAISGNSTASAASAASGSSATNSGAGAYVVGKAGTLTTQTSQTPVLGSKGDSSEQINAQESLSPPTTTPTKKNKKKKSKSRHNRSLHLVILEFIKMFSVTNDEIIYIDCTDAAIKNMKNINLCKTLKPHSHHAMQLQHHGKKDKNKSKRRQSREREKEKERLDGGHSPYSNSSHVNDDDYEEEEHWIMTQNIIDIIDAQIVDKFKIHENVNIEYND